MQAIVLVGGEGTRLRPLTYGTPKPMVPIMNVPFLARTLERLYAAGIKDVVLPAGYLPQAISDYFGDGSNLDMKITYVIEETPLGTAGALKNVEQHITGPFFVLNGDVLTSLDLRDMVRYHQEKGGSGVIHLIKVEDPSAFGCVVHDENGRVSAFVEKPPREQAPTNEINAGTYLLERSVLDMIPAGRNVSIERETFPKMLADGVPLYAYTTKDYWLDVGRPEHYLTAHRDILNGTMPLQLEPGISGPGAREIHASIIPPVHLDEDVQIAQGARIGPNVVIGRGCKIATATKIVDSVLWEDVIVEEGAVIEEAIIASGSRVGAGAHIARGSVIGHHTRIDPQRILEPGARVGPTGPLAGAK